MWSWATNTGKACQSWDTSTIQNYSDYGLDKNYCRNPGGQREKAWCYVSSDGSSSSSNAINWEYCNVPECQQQDISNLDANDRPAEGQDDDNNIKSTDIICYSKTNDCGCPNFPIYQSDYRGTINKTRAGYTCQKWNLLPQYPHVHVHSSANYPKMGLEDGSGNYCRNPDLDPNGSWCYTTDLTTRWDYCNIPNCYTVNGTTNIFSSDGTISSSSSITSGAVAAASFCIAGSNGFQIVLLLSWLSVTAAVLSL